MWRHQPEPRPIQLVDDCEAFLAGSYAEQLLHRDERVPVWAWANLLAHGTEEAIRAAARQPAPAPPWVRARWFLAGEIVDMVDAGRCSLDELQCDVLVPLELDIAACPATREWDPGRFVTVVRDLVRHRIAQLRR
jgi:hypothetical protein